MLVARACGRGWKAISKVERHPLMVMMVVVMMI
jgi:hypothetical protein